MARRASTFDCDFSRSMQPTADMPVPGCQKLLPYGWKNRCYLQLIVFLQAFTHVRPEAISNHALICIAAR